MFPPNPTGAGRGYSGMTSAHCRFTPQTQVSFGEREKTFTTHRHRLLLHTPSPVFVAVALPLSLFNFDCFRIVSGVHSHIHASWGLSSSSASSCSCFASRLFASWVITVKMHTLKCSTNVHSFRTLLKKKKTFTRSLSLRLKNPFYPLPQAGKFNTRNHRDHLSLQLRF